MTRITKFSALTKNSKLMWISYFGMRANLAGARIGSAFAFMETLGTTIDRKRVGMHQVHGPRSRKKSGIACLGRRVQLFCASAEKNKK